MSTAALPYRWTILRVTVAGQASTAALFQGLPSLGPALAIAFGLSLGEVGLALGSVIFGMTLTLLPWGLAADRFGERRVIPIALGATAVALCLVAAAPGYTTLVAALALAGLFASGANAAGGRAIMGWFSASERGLAMGLRTASIPIGGGLAAAVLPPLAEAWDVQGSLLALAVVTAVAGIAGWLWLRDPPTPAPASPRMGAVVRERVLWRLCAVAFLLTAAQYAFVGFLVLFLTDARGVEPAVAAFGLVGVQAASAVSRVVVGRWSDRVGSRIRPLRILAATSIAGFVLVALLTEAAPALLVPALVLAAVGAVSWNGLAFAATGELAPPGAAGAAIGLQNTAVALGAGTFLPVFGLLVERTSWGVGYAAVAVCAAAALGVLAGIDEHALARRTAAG